MQLCANFLAAEDSSCGREGRDHEIRATGDVPSTTGSKHGLHRDIIVVISCPAGHGTIRRAGLHGHHTRSVGVIFARFLRASSSFKRLVKAASAPATLDGARGPRSTNIRMALGNLRDEVAAGD